MKERPSLVSGAARQIGWHIALSLAESGVNIVIHYRQSFAEAESLRAQLTQHGVKAWLIQADFEREDPGGIVRNVVRIAGAVDFLVNNASSFVPVSIQDIDFAGLMKDVRVNAWSPFALSREFARQAGSGKIVNMLDTLRITGFDPAHAGYILSKRMLQIFTEILRQSN